MKDLGFKLLNSISTNNRFQALLLLSLIFVLLAPSLGSDFIWDDISQIAESETIGDLTRIPSYFTLNVVQSAGSAGRNAEGVDIYRPLFMVSLAAIYCINGPDPFWFHLAVLTTHLLVCLLLWIVAVRWLSSSLAAALAVFFFACHPVTAEAYLWPSAISEPLAAAGLFGAALILDRNNERASTAWVFAATGGFVFLAGLMSKEAILMALPALSFYMWRVRNTRIRLLFPLWTAGFVFLLLRSIALGGLQATGTDTVQRLHMVKIFPVLILDGLRAMITMWPVGIRHLSWEYEAISWPMSLFAAVVGLAILATAVALRRVSPLLLTASLVTGLMLAPIAMVATVPGWGGFGRYLYVPLAFTCLGFAELGMLLQRRIQEQNPRLRLAIPVLIAIVLLVEQVGLHHALMVYSNQENLARAAIEIYPDGPDGYEWLGNCYLDRGDLPSALRCFRQATERGPELYRPRHNLAAALLYTGRPEEALVHLEIAEKIHGATSDGSMIVVTALLQLGWWDEAASRLLDALDKFPDDPALHGLATRLLTEHPRPEELRSWLEEKTAQPEHQNAAEALSQVLGASRNGPASGAKFDMSPQSTRLRTEKPERSLL